MGDRDPHEREVSTFFLLIWLWLVEVSGRNLRGSIVMLCKFFLHFIELVIEYQNYKYRGFWL